FDGTVRRRGISMVYHDTVEVNVFIWYKTEKVGEICSDILIPPPPCVCPILTKDVEEEEDEDEDDDDEEEEEEDREDAEVGGKDEEEEGNRHGIIDSETEFYAKHKSAGERWFDVTKIPLRNLSLDFANINGYFLTEDGHIAGVGMAKEPRLRALKQLPLSSVKTSSGGSDASLMASGAQQERKPSIDGISEEKATPSVREDEDPIPSHIQVEISTYEARDALKQVRELLGRLVKWEGK
ncbi:hypothetical protein ADUPG1_011036, partial [Aduncisulcus paluster]